MKGKSTKKDFRDQAEKNCYKIQPNSDRYIELFATITGDTFVKSDLTDINNRIEENVLDWLK